jgi:NADH dehydrogenase [ubiquinone] 1 alpha subcomplex assembly factor 7
VSAEATAATLGESIAARIDQAGAISLHDYMALANAHYYASRDPLGRAGDFITAPEISQMFGEMIGLWLGDIAGRAGAGESAAYVELGPGRGTLAADALRALARAGCRPPVHLVETSPALRAAQGKAVPGACFHDVIGSLPEDRTLLIVANEFFDALPIRQYLRTDVGWRERVVVNDRVERGHRFLLDLSGEDAASAIPPGLRDAAQGSIVETCPSAVAIMRTLAERIARQGGVMIAIDYGYAGPVTGDSFQAVQAHRFADPFVEPGARDLTAHVDFTVLAEAARAGGAVASPMVEQGGFLMRLGIGARAEALAQRNPDAREGLMSGIRRLTDEAAMGRLFKVMAFRHPGWPEPEGLA